MRRSLCVCLLLLVAVTVTIDAQRARARRIRARPGVTAASGQSQYVACTTTVANLTQSTTQTAVNNAADGAVLCLPSGSATWSGTVDFSNSKGVTIAGQEAIQGSGATTTITVGTSGTIMGLSALSGTNTHTYRITGIQFSRTAGVTSGTFWFYGQGVTASLAKVRIDHNTFTGFDDNTGSDTGTILYLGESTSPNTVYALIDHNTWTATYNSMFVKPFGNGLPNTNHASSHRGTASAVVMEDNTFTFTTVTANTLGGGCVDSWRAAEFVIRYNTFTNCLTTFHGVDHATTLLTEIYGNTFERTSGSGGIWEDGQRLLHHQGSGEMFIWGNTFKHTGTINSSAIEMTHYRSAPCDTDNNYDCAIPQCDGTSTTTYPDGNTSPTATYRGYPCWYQPGRAPNGGSPAWGILSPVYFWQNADNSTGNLVGVDVDAPFTGSPIYVTTHLVANRDYFIAVSKNAQTSSTSPFDGTTGVGFGTLANRPTTCTHTTAPDGDDGGGVAYFATDQGTWKNGGAGGVLYRCSATNTWTVQYTPYTYPYPWP